MAVTGAILGDIAGSQYEHRRPRDLDYKNCEIFTKDCHYTDDTVMTLAVKKALQHNLNIAETFQELGRKHPGAGFGWNFYEWLFSDDPQPYGSYGNGSAMRASFVGEFFENPEDVAEKAKETAAVSHNHPEGIKGAVVTAMCVHMAIHKKSKEEIYNYVLEQYPPEEYKFSIDKDLEYIRTNYSWSATCMDSVAVAMRCFYESDSYESFIRNVFSFRCDCDTLCAIGGGVAEEFYHGTGFDNETLLKKYLPEDLYQIWKD